MSKSKLTKLLGPLWKREVIPKGELMIMPIHKNSDRYPCGNHKENGSVNTESKLLDGFILRRLPSTAEICMRENQAGFFPGQDCVSQIFALRQILEHKRILHRLYFCLFWSESGFWLSRSNNSVAPSLIEECAGKFISMLQLLHTNKPSRVHKYDVSPKIIMGNGVLQGFPSTFSFQPRHWNSYIDSPIPAWKWRYWHSLKLAWNMRMT